MKISISPKSRVNTGADYLNAYYSHLRRDGEVSMKSKDSKKSNRPTFLIADDDPMLLQTIAMQLLDKGCEVKTAKNFSQIKSQLNSFSPDVALLDYAFPEKNGLEVVGWMRENKVESEAVLIMSAYERAKVQAEKRRVAFLGKPFTVEELFSEIERQREGLNLLEKERDKWRKYFTRKQLVAPEKVLYKGFLGDLVEFMNHDPDEVS